MTTCGIYAGALALLLVALPAAAQKSDGASNAPSRRVIGSLLFPERGNMVRESSALKIVTPQVVEITKKAMEFVRASQLADGSWGDKQFSKSTGVAALCCMALLAEGSLPRVGYSGAKLDKGIAYLLSTPNDDGLLVAKENMSTYGPMYDHVWATFVLLQAYGNAPWYPDMRAKISRSVQAIIKAQRVDGGWRYQVTPMGRSDLSVTATCIATLRQARMSGFAVPEATFAKAQAFAIRCGDFKQPEDAGTFCLIEAGERGGATTTSSGLYALYSSGQYTHSYVKPCSESVAYVYRRMHLSDVTESPLFADFNMGVYYVSQAMYVAGDAYWIPWFRKYTLILAEIQDKNGSIKDRKGNTVYPTAVAALVLQAPLGYMPQYLR